MIYLLATDLKQQFTIIIRRVIKKVRAVKNHSPFFNPKPL